MRFLLASIALFLGAPVHGEISLDGRMPEEVIPQLGELIEIALEKSDTVRERELYEGEAEGRRIAARSAVRPKFTTNLSLRQEKDEDVDGESSFEDRVVYNVVFKQPLYHWGALKSQKEIGELQADMEGLSSSQTISKMVQRIRKEYLGLIIAKQQLERRIVDLEEAQAKLEFQRDSVEKGVAGKATTVANELDVERKDLALFRSQNDWENRLNSLALVVGVDPAYLEGKIVGEVPEVELLSLDSLNEFSKFYQRGIEIDESYQRMNLDLEVEKRRMKIVDQSLKPKIDAQLGLSSNALDLDGTRREQSYSYFGLAVAWNIFDGFRKKGNALEASYRLSRKERNIEKLESSLLIGFEEKRAKLEIELRSLAIEERVLRATKGQLKYTSERVENGLSSETELIDIERRFTNASIQAQSMRINYLVALSDLVSEFEVQSL